MEKTEINELMLEVDATILNTWEQLAEYANRYTVPIFQEPSPNSNPVFIGTGVLIKSDVAYMIVTADHVVKELNPQLSLIIGIKGTPHRFDFTPVNFKSYTEEDVGIIYVHEVDARKIESLGNRIFLSKNKWLKITQEELEKINDWVLVGGYPKFLCNEKSTHSEMGFFCYLGTAAGTGAAPSANCIKLNDLRIWVPKNGNIELETKYLVEIPALSGLSGGGVWLLNFRKDRLNWVPDKIVLIGIYHGRYLDVNPDNDIFASATSLFFL